MCYLPGVTPGITPVMATLGLPCGLAEPHELPRGKTCLEHPISMPNPAPGSTQSSADFGTIRLIFCPREEPGEACHPPGHLLVPTPVAWDLPLSSQQKSTRESSISQG